MALHIQQAVAETKDKMVFLRRYFHENPELSLQETETLAVIKKELSLYHIPYTHVENGGIIAVLQGKQPGRTLLLRADIDALPIEENPCNLSGRRICISRRHGVMHACGHDGHTAMLLGAAKILSEHRTDFSGTVVFMFEQGEEESGPLEKLLHYLKEESGLHIDGCYATHVRWDVPTGKIAILDGAPMAGGFGFKIKITGKGGHGSRPDLAKSPIDCFHAFYNDLQSLRMRIVSPRQCLAVSLGSVHSGEALNVIPAELVFSGTCRFFSYEDGGRQFYEAFLSLLEKSCAVYGCTYEILHLPKPLFEVRNQLQCTAIARRAAISCLGQDALGDCEPWMASETFAITSRLYPGVLVFTGIANAEKGSGANHHTPEFDLDEDGLTAGLTMCLAYTQTFLTNRDPIEFTPNPEPLDSLAARNI